ncbi:GNAT family N-acetyltransferase [Paracidovorax citrulli]
MNQWLQRSARQQQDRGLSRTYVATFEKEPDRIAGYYAISATQVHTDGGPHHNLPNRVSAALLGRLAVAQIYKGKGLGTQLLMHALEQAVRAAQIIGIHCMVVDVLDTSAADFYRRYGFEFLSTEPLRLVLPLGTIRGA